MKTLIPSAVTIASTAPPAGRCYMLQGTANAAHTIYKHMRINCDRPHVGMTERFLRGSACSRWVANEWRTTWGARLVDPGTSGRSIHGPLDS